MLKGNYTLANEYLTFFEKIELLEKVIKVLKDDEDEDMRNRFSIWLKEMNRYGHIGYPKDKFRGVEDL